MRAIQIGFVMVVGVAYVAVRIANPEMGLLATWSLRIGLLLLIGAVFVVTNIASGRAADASPLEAEEMPSLNLTARQHDADPASDARQS